ncbi:MAG: DUF3426 domain-containing protein [Woeseiaceae bacterium]
MYTRCPTCATCFRVTDRHLSIAKGKVRCGQCQLVFNAPENAIDDLPTKASASPANKESTPAPIKTDKFDAVTIKSTKPDILESDILKSKTFESKPSKPIIPKAKDLKPESIISEPPSKPIATPAVSKTIKTKSNTLKTDKHIEKQSFFDADATMLTNINDFDNEDIDEINLDNTNKKMAAVNDDDDDIFANIDLSSALDEFTQLANESESTAPTVSTEETENEVTSVEEDDSHEDTHQEIHLENKDPFIADSNIFSTDAYDATQATSVKDIMSEMEGQLSLDISETETSDDVTYDANEEFNFLQIDELKHDSKPEAPEFKDDDDFDVDDDSLNSLFDEENESKDNDTQDEFEDSLFQDVETDRDAFEDSDIIEIKTTTQIEDDEVFDKIDVSGFDESNIQEEIVIEDKLNNDDIPIQLRNDIDSLQAPKGRRLHPILYFILTINLLVLAIAQLSYFRAHELVRIIPESRPLLIQFCEQFNCHYSGPIDISKIKMISRDVRLHPKEKNALLISAAMINHASFAQPYPKIHIRLSDISGNIIAERTFDSKIYLGKLSHPFLLMKSKTPVHINFEVVDPGKDAINFEFSFL